MYKILGADKKEYGPVSAEQVRQWITERRLDGQTQVQAEGTTEWRLLGSLPEFSSALTSVLPPASAQIPATLAALTSSAGTMPRNNPMAVAGLIMGICTISFGWCCCYGLPFNLLGIIFSAMALSQINKQPALEKGKGLAIAGLILSVLGTVLAIVIWVLFGMSRNFDEMLRYLKR